MFNLIIDWLPSVASFLAGVIPTIVFFRSKLRKHKNAYILEEFTQLQLVVDQSSKQITELSSRLREMEEIRTSLARQIEELKRENQSLRGLIEELKLNNHDRTKPNKRHHEKGPATEVANRLTIAPRRRSPRRTSAPDATPQ